MCYATYSGKNRHFLCSLFFHYFSVFSKKWKNVKKWHFLTILCHFSAPGYYDLWNQVFFRDLKNVTFCHFGKSHENRWFFSDFQKSYMTSSLWHILKNIIFIFSQLFASFSIFSKNAKMWKTCFLHVLKSCKNVKKWTHMLKTWYFMGCLGILASFETCPDEVSPGSWNLVIGPLRGSKNGPKIDQKWHVLK